MYDEGQAMKKEQIGDEQSYFVTQKIGMSYQHLISDEEELVKLN